MPLEISEIGVRVDVTEEKSDSSKKTQDTCERDCEKSQTPQSDEEDSVMPAEAGIQSQRGLNFLLHL